MAYTCGPQWLGISSSMIFGCCRSPHMESSNLVVSGNYALIVAPSLGFTTIPNLPQFVIL